MKKESRVEAAISMTIAVILGGIVLVFLFLMFVTSGAFGPGTY